MIAATTETRFHTFQTMWEKLDPHVRAQCVGFDEFYRACLLSAALQGIYQRVECEVVAERNWLAIGKPYYKLWPGYAVMLSRTSLAIPTAVFRTPHPAFAVHLPQRPELFRFEHAGRPLVMRSLLVAHAEAVRLAYPVLTVAVDDGEDIHSVLTLHVEPGQTMEDCLRTTPHDGTTSHDLTATALRLAVAVSLLAVSVHRCVEHDVIAALRERYARATTAEERDRLAERSRRRGVNGWCIGRGRCLSLVTRGPGDEASLTRRELTYQHVRGGHFHTVRHGPGKSRSKVMFYEPTVVRPDLPPPPLERARAG